MTPPPKSLGIYALPPNTHNGEEIEIDGAGYVVTSLVLKYRASGGARAARAARAGTGAAARARRCADASAAARARAQLHKGRYVRDHSRLEVQPTSRFFLNIMLDSLIHGTYRLAAAADGGATEGAAAAAMSSLYPSLPGREDGGRPSYGYGTSGPPYYPPSQPPALSSQGSLEQHSPWAADTNSTLRVKIADDYRLAPPVAMPPALAGSSGGGRGPEFDYDLERQVMAADASTSFDAFLAKPEDSFYDNTKAARFVRAGFSPAVVNLALAYHAANRGGGDDQIMAFCENFRTLTQEMSFSAALAAGALVKTKNDLAAAANLITELS
ncbi:hypothetical protein HT031_001526 [Scenedesmus sp. PABB004]|nr:hypothetical protein HT031_001526 [Scenedesmus sp. PABB004]